jgi:hypothetical protein
MARLPWRVLCYSKTPHSDEVAKTATIGDVTPSIPLACHAFVVTPILYGSDFFMHNFASIVKRLKRCQYRNGSDERYQFRTLFVLLVTKTKNPSQFLMRRPVFTEGRQPVTAVTAVTVVTHKCQNLHHKIESLWAVLSPQISRLFAIKVGK